MSVRPAATRLDGRLMALSVALLLLISAAGFLYLSQASTVAHLRYCLADSAHAQAKLEEEIAYLRCQIASKQSLASLEGRVEELGFVDASADAPVLICRVSSSESDPTALLEDSGAQQ